MTGLYFIRRAPTVSWIGFLPITFSTFPKMVGFLSFGFPMRAIHFHCDGTHTLLGLVMPMVTRLFSCYFFLGFLRASPLSMSTTSAASRSVSAKIPTTLPSASSKAQTTADALHQEHWTPYRRMQRRQFVLQSALYSAPDIRAIRHSF